jgi:hypothetical protein
VPPVGKKMIVQERETEREEYMVMGTKPRTMRTVKRRKERRNED